METLSLVRIIDTMMYKRSMAIDLYVQCFDHVRVFCCGGDLKETEFNFNVPFPLSPFHNNNFRNLAGFISSAMQVATSRTDTQVAMSPTRSSNNATLETSACDVRRKVDPFDHLSYPSLRRLANAEMKCSGISRLLY